MKARFINELTEGCRVDSTFVLRSREMRAARNGDAYLSLELGDRTGSIPGVMFRPGADAGGVPAGGAVRVRGTVTVYRGIRRVSVEHLEPTAEWSVEDLVGSGVRDRNELVAELRQLVRKVKDPGLRRLLRTVFGDKAFFESFVMCPASQGYHHAYIGGLLEHTVSVASLCVDAADRYDGIDADVLVAAALLHDIGKVDELTFSTGIAYSDSGRLMGHVVSGAMRLRDASARVDLDADVLLRLEHAVISHHGELEWGSPKRPSTFEALLLHHIDNLDAKAAGFAALLSGATIIEENWTDAANLFRRPLYAPKPVDDDRPTRPTEDDAHFRLSA
ncbi:MAG TPA: HD domain-containing protein [Coriobacteriia bacterium]|nr:HD domain-containing protein [Coriobacteriia bacterium]